MKLKTSTDIMQLGALYQELMEDEQADAQYTDSQSRERMAAFLESGELAYIAEEDGETVGYALVDFSPAPCYLHHFYICRSHRRKGYGRAFFELLMDSLNITQIDLNVFIWNERGQAFWQSLGFKPRCIAMRYQHDHD